MSSWITGWSYILPAGKCPGHLTRNGTRTPPSSVVRFEPRSGLLRDALTVVPCIVGPPLSLMKNTSVLSSSFLSRKACNILPIASSIADIMAAYVRRFSSLMLETSSGDRRSRASACARR